MLNVLNLGGGSPGNTAGHAGWLILKKKSKTKKNMLNQAKIMRILEASSHTHTRSVTRKSYREVCHTFPARHVQEINLQDLCTALWKLMGLARGW